MTIASTWEGEVVLQEHIGSFWESNSEIMMMMFRDLSYYHSLYLQLGINSTSVIFRMLQ